MKNNRVLLAFLFSATFLLATAFSTQTVLANNVQVFLDGTELNYTYVQPQIINDRTMVPLTETARHFGMESSWDPATATMVFTAPGRTMIHTVHTDSITVNGTPVTFPGMPSMIMNDRTLMPVRMLAEAIGHTVEWDPSGIVDIWSNATQQPPTNQGTNQGTATGNITIISATAASLTSDYGQPVLIRVSTNNAADRIRITDSSGDNELATSNEFTEDTQGRHFEVYVTPEDSGEITLRVFAGNASGFTTTPQNVMLNIVPAHTITITNLRLSGTGTDRNRFNTNSDVAGTFRTSTDVVRVRIEDSSGRAVDTINRYANAFSNFRSWELEFRSPNTNGTFTYYIVAFDRDDNYYSLPFEIIVGSGTTSNQTTTTAGHTINVSTPGVSSVVVYNLDRDNAHNNVRVSDRVRFTITTDNTIDEIEILHDNMISVHRTHNFTTSGSQRIWQFEFIPNYSGSNYYLRVVIDESWDHQIDTRRLSGFNVGSN